MLLSWSFNPVFASPIVRAISVLWRFSIESFERFENVLLCYVIGRFANSQQTKVGLWALARPFVRSLCPFVPSISLPPFPVRRSFVRSLVHSCQQPCIHSFIHSFIEPLSLFGTVICHLSSVNECYGHTVHCTFVHW